MKTVDREYEQSFLLEPTKLRRIVDTVRARLAQHSGFVLAETFEAFLSNNRREEMTTLDQVLAIDNSRKHRIKRLVIQSTATAPDASRPAHVVQVDFAGPKSPAPGETSRSNAKVVAISVRSDDAGWASGTLSEVEEQVERAWLRHTSILAILITLLAIVAIFVGSQLFPLQIQQ